MLFRSRGRRAPGRRRERDAAARRPLRVPRVLPAQGPRRREGVPTDVGRGDAARAPFLEREGPAIELLEPLQRLRSRTGGELKWWGGVKALGGHFTIVRGNV